MTIPSTINILGSDYAVIVRKMAGEEVGLTEPCERRITLEEGLSHEVLVETFYHELVHAVLAHTGLDSLLKEDVEEALAQGIGMSLAYIISTNALPKLEAEDI